MTIDAPAQTATVETTEPDVTQDVITDSPATGPANTVDSLPDWAQAIIKDARNEAAKYRTEKTKAQKEAEKQAQQQAEQQGEYQKLYEQAKMQLEEANQIAEQERMARLKATVAHKLNLPAALVDRLRGNTEDELAADAQALLDAMPKPVITTRTDSTNGVNSDAPTPAKSDREIQELAARIGVRFEDLKKQYIKE